MWTITLNKLIQAVLGKALAENLHLQRIPKQAEHNINPSISSIKNKEKKWNPFSA